MTYIIIFIHFTIITVHSTKETIAKEAVHYWSFDKSESVSAIRDERGANTLAHVNEGKLCVMIDSFL